MAEGCFVSSVTKEELNVFLWQVKLLTTSICKKEPTSFLDTIDHLLSVEKINCKGEDIHEGVRNEQDPKLGGRDRAESVSRRGERSKKDGREVYHRGKKYYIVLHPIGRDDSDDDGWEECDGWDFEDWLRYLYGRS